MSECPTCVPRSRLVQAEFETGAHSLSCPASSLRYEHHQGVLGHILTFMADAFQAAVDTTDISCHVRDGERIDAVLGLPYSHITNGKSVGLDVTCPCTTCPSFVSPQAAQSATAVTDRAEGLKAEKHRADCEQIGLKYVTAAVTSMGGWGNEFLKLFVRPHFKEMRAQELKAGGSGWEATAAKRRFFERAAVVVARANAAMIATAISGDGKGGGGGRRA